MNIRLDSAFGPVLREFPAALNAENFWLKTRQDALVDAAKDICPYCGGRAPAGVLRGPNESGNFTHGAAICAASAIWSRIAMEAKLKVQRTYVATGGFDPELG